MRVLIGYDEREHAAAEVAAKSLQRVTHNKIQPEFLCLPKLMAQGLLTRPVDQRGGQDWDLVSNAPMSTRFAISRFLTPIICQGGYALFVDSDVVFHRDPREMLLEVHAENAVSVVKHKSADFTPPMKMGGQVNSPYEKKLWSSVMLFNCDHAANRRLSLWDVNNRTGLWLHQFGWLHESEIGSLANQWNVLLGIDDIPPMPGILHWTLGGPFNKNWPGGPHDSLWEEYAAR